MLPALNSPQKCFVARRKRLGVICLLLFLFAASMMPLAAFNLGIAGPEDAPQLLTIGGDQGFRIPVAHQHAASGCGGYLYFSPKTIRFEVNYPERDKAHAFEYPRADLVVAQQWRFMGSSMPEAEFKFKDGRVFHFFRVKRKLAESESAKMTWDNVLPHDLLLEAATNFQSVRALAQATQELMAGGAKPAAAAAAPANPAPADDAAMGSAGLDVPPPPPWMGAGTSPAPSPGTTRGRP